MFLLDVPNRCPSKQNWQKSAFCASSDPVTFQMNKFQVVGRTRVERRGFSRPQTNLITSTL